MAKEGITISFRLHPSDPKEKQAIEIIQDLQAKGYAPREIMTDAILRAAGYTPEMFREGGDKLTPSLLESILAEFARDMLQEIRAAGGTIPTQQSSKPSPFDEDEDEEFSKNIAAGWAARNKR